MKSCNPDCRGLRHYSGRGLRAQLDGYLHRIIERDFEEQGLSVRRPETLKRWMVAYAASHSHHGQFRSHPGCRNEVARVTSPPKQRPSPGTMH